MPSYRSAWDTLSQSSLHRICISFLNDPKELILTRSDRADKLAKLLEIIDEFETSVDCKIMTDPKMGANCLIPIDDGKTRGRILGFGTDDQGNFVRVFSCDYGLVNEYDYNEVFETNKEIVEFMPYTAIYGSFAGIEPNDGKTYDETVSRDIWNMLDMAQRTGKLYAQVVKMNESLDWLPGINRYDLVLAFRSEDGSETKLLNHEMVAKNVAQWDKIAGPVVQQLKPEHLQQEFDYESNEDDEENWEEVMGTYKHEVPPAEEKPQIDQFNDICQGFDDNLDENEKFELLAMLGLSATEIATIRELGVLNKHKPAPIIPTKAIETVQEEETKPISVEIPLTVAPKELKNDFLVTKAPSSTILWQQTHAVIILSIQVGDTPDYHLDIHDSYMMFALFPSIDAEPQLTIVNFFASIKPKSVSHQIRGLNLIIRLPKRYPGLLWTQLQIENEKFSNIKYNLDTMMPLDDDFVPIKSNEKERQSDESDDDTTDSDALVEDSESGETSFDEE